MACLNNVIITCNKIMYTIFIQLKRLFALPNLGNYWLDMIYFPDGYDIAVLAAK